MFARKISVLMFVVAMLFAGSSYAQVEQGNIRANVGVTYMFKAFGDSDSPTIGFGVGGEYLITDVLSVAPSYYLSQKNLTRAGNALKFNINTLNIDVRYYFMNNKTQLYGLVGYQSISSKASGDVAGTTISATVNSGGVAFGGGAVIGLSDKIGINPELKYGLAKSSSTDAFGLLVNFGVVYSF